MAVKNESPVKIRCAKCRKLKPRTVHHLYPRRWFKALGIWKYLHREKINLCAECHRELEDLIEADECAETGCRQQLPLPYYRQVVADFCGMEFV